MDCQTTQQKLLDRGWSAAELAEAAELARHAQACEACRAALADYETLRSLLIANDERTEPAGGWSAFADRMRDAGVGKVGPTPAWSGTLHRPHALRRILGPLALAASLALAFAGWGLYLRGTPSSSMSPIASPPAPGNAGVALASAQFTPEEVRQKVQAFEEVSEVFDRQAGWIAVAGETSDLGLAPSPIGGARRVVLLRLTLSRGATVVSQADLVIVPGQTAELTVPFQADQRLRYRAATTAERPMRLSVAAEVLSPRQPDQIYAAVASTLPMTPGQVRPAGELVTITGDYQLKVGFSESDLPVYSSPAGGGPTP